MQSIPKKIHSYSAYLIFQKVKLKKAKIFVFPFSFYQDHLRMKWSEIFPASVLSRDKAQCHLLTATFWDNHGLNTLLCWWLLVSNESASFSTFRRAPNTCESGFVLFPLRNTWMLRLAWAHGKRNSLLVIQKVGKWLMSWSRQGQGTRTGKRQEEQGKKKKKKADLRSATCLQQDCTTHEEVTLWLCHCTGGFAKGLGETGEYRGCWATPETSWKRGARKQKSFEPALHVKMRSHPSPCPGGDSTHLCPHFTRLLGSYRERNKLRETPAPVSRTACCSV